MIAASEIIGFIASGLVLTTFAMRDMRLLRALAICSNVAFIIYGGVNCLVPVLVLHLLPLPLNVFRLKESKDERVPDSFRIDEKKSSLRRGHVGERLTSI